MGMSFLTYATATILNAVSNGYLYGFDIVDITGMPGGTVYPALRRLEDAGYLSSTWEKESVAQAELRPISIDKVNVPRIWSLVTCVKEKH